MSQQDLSFRQIQEILRIVHSLYGYDFSGYAKASLKRRLLRIMEKRNQDIAAFKYMLVNDPGFISSFVTELTVNVTEMFRDPFFFQSVRNNLLPYLETWPALLVWNAGCSTGEEAYSFSILLREAGLLNRSRIYGTDINPEVLEKAKEGIYPLHQMKKYAENYYASGGNSAFSSYYTARYDAGIMKNNLKKNMTFHVHNLVGDQVFNTFQLIVCRNVYIYFEVGLQEKVLELFYNSLCPFGFLCLGAKETIRFTKLSSRFRVIDKDARIYQRID
jgi:chemotaxis protein methyltransferase CheR